METSNKTSLQNYSQHASAKKGRRVQARGHALFTAQASGTHQEQTNPDLFPMELVVPRLTKGRW